MVQPPAGPSVDEIEDELEEEGGELLGGRVDRKHLFWGLLFVVVVVVFLYVGLPRLAGLRLLLLGSSGQQRPQAGRQHAQQARHASQGCQLGAVS